MKAPKCGLCGAPHGPFESCYFPKAVYYVWAYEWLTVHPNEGGQYEICWVVPLQEKPSWDRPVEDDRLLSRYFRLMMGVRCTGGSATPPSKSRTNHKVFSGGTDKVAWTIIYRWAPDMLEDARRYRDWLAEEQERRLDQPG